MRKIIVPGLALLAAACADVSAPPRSDASDVAAAPPASPAIPNEYIVVFRDGVSNSRALTNQLAAAHGANVRFTYESAVRGFAANMSANAAEALARNPNVLLVEEDQEVSAIATQTMDGAGDPWGLDRIDARSGLSKSYTYALTGTGVHVYIIDSGIRGTHAEFGGRAVSGMTSINDGRGTDDCAGHGTHVAGTVGGSTYGVAKNVALVAVRVLNCSGSGSWAGVIAGIDWVTANAVKPAVANMSLGGGASSAVDLAIENSIASGVVYAVAAGNGNNGGVAQNACNYSPARAPNALTIGATQKSDAKVSWSNYGSCVDWFAPGVGIKSAWIGSDTDTETISGTSMATPHTAGVAALYLQSSPSASPAAVRSALFAALTKGVVASSNTTNNHLLYSPPAGFGVEPPPPPPSTIALTVSLSKNRSNWTATLAWNGATSASVDVFRNGALLKTVANTGSTTDSGKGGSGNTYQVCQAGTTVCSNSVIAQ